MLKVQSTTRYLRGSLTLGLQRRKLYISAEDRSTKVQRMSKLELWLLNREIEDQRVSNAELIALFDTMDIPVTPI